MGNITPLKRQITAADITVAPGISDSLGAVLVEQAGFETAYLSGASIAYSRFGRPDIGLVTMTEVADTLSVITERSDLRVIVDADTGFGNALNVMRTVRLFESAGAAAIQLEDQTLPKRCGHLAGKTLVPTGEMIGKIKAALDARRSDDTLIIARTDGIAVEGFDAALDRASRYAEAGADILFVEAPQSEEQMRAITKRFAGQVPLMANMVEGGYTPQKTAAELQALGFSLVIFPGGMVRAVAKTMQSYIAGLKEHGTNVPFRDRMLNFDELNGLLGTTEMLALGEGYDAVNFEEMMIDPVTLAVLKGRLEQIADEMDATLFRSAFNPIIAEAHDASHGLYHAETGDTLVQGKSGLPIFVGAMSFAVKAVIEKAARDGDLADGDVYIFNDPYAGGTHLSDFRLVRPFYRDGKVFCYLASVGHWHDVGGNVPGNYNPVATESFQEGMLIPPVKLFRKGELRQDIVNIMQANSRLPGSLYGDMNGQINALDLGMRRMEALLEEYGDDTVNEALTELRARAAKLMAANIADLPDGTWSAEDYLDNDGIVDEPLKIALDLTIKGDQMTLDFSRSSDACAGPVNIALSTTVASVYVALKHVFTDVPANGGVLEPITVVVPDTSLLSVTAPKPVGGYTETILRIIDVVFCAVANVAPERVNGCAYGTINALSLAGHRKDGSRWVMFSFFGGGHGGHPEGDGLNHGNAPISTATIPPAEILEAAYPVMFTQWALRPNSGGAGTHRGGLGAIYEIELLEENADVFLFGERGKFAPPGVLGGKPAAMNSFTYQQDDGEYTPPMVSKMVGIKLKKGQRLHLETPGGGGYGAPNERDPQAVMRDIALGYVDEASATQDYSIALDSDGELDLDETKNLRTKVQA